MLEENGRIMPSKYTVRGEGLLEFRKEYRGKRTGSTHEVKRVLLTVERVMQRSNIPRMTMEQIRQIEGYDQMPIHKARYNEKSP